VKIDHKAGSRVETVIYCLLPYNEITMRKKRQQSIIIMTQSMMARNQVSRLKSADDWDRWSLSAWDDRIKSFCGKQRTWTKMITTWSLVTHAYGNENDNNG
jgi:hypothetical protein